MDAREISEKEYAGSKGLSKLILKVQPEERKSGIYEGKWERLLNKGGSVEVAEREDGMMPQLVEEINPYIKTEIYTPGSSTALFRLGSFNENAINVLRDYEKKHLIEVL